MLVKLSVLQIIFLYDDMLFVHWARNKFNDLTKMFGEILFLSKNHLAVVTKSRVWDPSEASIMIRTLGVVGTLG